MMEFLQCKEDGSSCFLLGIADVDGSCTAAQQSATEVHSPSSDIFSFILICDLLDEAANGLVCVKSGSL
jgi:hypothetical protein